MSEQKIPIPAMLYNAAVGGHVTNSQQIIDENLNREQNDINQETVGAVPYNSTTPNGMGKIVLKKTDNFKQVVEAQTAGNTIFVIKYDFILTDNVLIPADCVLEFDGGSISGEYTITFTDTKIVANKEVFDISGVAGTIVNKEVYLSWWKLAYNSEVNDAILINQIIATVDNCVFYYDIQNNIYVGGVVSDNVPNPDYVTADYSIIVSGKNNITILQTTSYFTILKGTSRGGQVFWIHQNNKAIIIGLNIDGNNIHQQTVGENGLGVSENIFVDISDCIIKNCQKGFDSIQVRGDEGTYPDYGSGGKGIQIEGGTEKSYAFAHNCTVLNSYAGISNNQANKNTTTFDHIHIEDCNIAIIALKFGSINEMTTFSNITIKNCTGENGLICMGNVANVIMRNIDIKGGTTASSLIRGAYANCSIDITSTQQVTILFDNTLFRDNPEGSVIARNEVHIVCANTSVVFGKSTLQYADRLSRDSFAKYNAGLYVVNLYNGDTCNLTSDSINVEPRIELYYPEYFYIGGFSTIISSNNRVPYNTTIWGNSTNRPSNPPYGFCFFDITLSPARPIWYYNGNWVDATGATV